ncbi:hypothetical protein AB1Y20_005140 [Prymnesium parvum]|uniref:EF-hand domain-containing protein n=1 Tax=Prymnesium parvum TaxID=97485 RepID=A0AB34J511_PRYPA
MEADSSEDERRAIALSLSDAAARPRRAAAQRAVNLIVEQAAPKLEPLGVGSDASEGEEAEDDGGEEEGGEEESEVESARGPPLSAYELQRQQNIASNREQLALLGLLPPETPAATPRASNKAHAPRRRESTERTRVQPKRARSSAPAIGSSRASAKLAASKPVRRQQKEVLVDTTSDSAEEDEVEEGSKPTVGLDDAERLQLGGIFHIIRHGFQRGHELAKEQVMPQPDELIRPVELSRVSAELQLSTDFDCAALVDLFDPEGKGALTFEDFCRVAQQVQLESFLGT